MLEKIRDRASQQWTGIYLRILAVILLYGALVHVGNMAGLTDWHTLGSNASALAADGYPVAPL